MVVSGATSTLAWVIVTLTSKLRISKASSQQELILNAVALSAVLQIDEPLGRVSSPQPTWNSRRAQQDHTEPPFNTKLRPGVSCWCGEGSKLDCDPKNEWIKIMRLI